MRKELLHMKFVSEDYDNYIYINWYVDNTPRPGSGPGILPALEKIKEFCTTLISHYRDRMGKTLIFEFHGPAVEKNSEFLEVIRFLHQHTCKAGIISRDDGSPGNREKILDTDEILTLVYSPDNVLPAHFYERVAQARGKVSLQVKIQISPEHWHRAMEMGKKIIVSFPEIPCTFIPIVNAPGENKKRVDFTTEQKTQLRQIHSMVFQNLSHHKGNMYRGFMRNYYTDGSSREQAPLDYILNNENTWAGWICWAGIQQLVINEKGDVFRAWCTQDWLGNINQDQFSFPGYPVFCTRNKCLNDSDIPLKRQQFIT